MIPKALQAYATMEALWSEGMDFIEIYAIMSIKCLENALSNRTYISDKELKAFFNSEYGIDNLTIGASRKILKRLSKKQILSRRSDGTYAVVTPKLAEFLKNLGNRVDISNDIKSIITQIKYKAADKYKCDFTDIDIERGLLNFFSNNDGEMALTGDISAISSTPKYKPDTKSQKIKFIISQYVLEQSEQNSPNFYAMLSFASGHMVASVMAMDDFVTFDGSLPSLTVYFDSPLVFALLELSSNAEKCLVEEIVRRLQELKASIKIAIEHHGELSNSIQHAIGLLEQEMPDKSKANKIYLFALEQGLTADDLRLKLLQIDVVLKKYHISIESTSPKEAGHYMLDHKEIEQRIKDVFTQGGEYNLPSHRHNSVARDAKVIYRTLALRGAPTSVGLIHCNAILASNNIGLCKVPLYKDPETKMAGIPLCMTPESLSAILWGNRPKINSNLNKIKLVCACVRNITLKASIVRDFYKDIKAKHSAHAISDEDYLNLSTSKLVPTILNEETFNFENFYSDEVARDVLRRVNEQNEIKNDRLEKRVAGQSDHLKKIAIRMGWGVSIVIGIIFAVLAILTKFWDWDHITGFSRTCFILFSLLFSLWGILNWTGLFPKFANIRKCVSLMTYNMLSTEHLLTKDDF